MKWKYTAIDFLYDSDPLELIKDLNDFGKNGWELVSTTKLNDTAKQERLLYIFKTPVQ